MTSGLALKGLKKSFVGKTIIRDVDLDIEAGRVVGVVGPNGSGKTTLFSLIAGYLQPDAGTVQIDGSPVSPKGAHCGKLGILPQDARFLPQVTIREQFTWYARLMGFGRQAARQETERVLALTDLVEAGNKTGGQLSHGMHKRAAVSQAFIGEPGLLVLDEPTAGLDPANARVMRELIEAQRGQRTILVSSHDLEEVADLCDDITIFDRGRLVTSESIRSFTGDEGILTFSLAAAAPDALLDRLNERPEVTRVDTNADRTRIACRLGIEDAENPDEIAALLGVIQSEGATFLQVTKGSTLEDRFYEVTRGGPARQSRTADA